MNNEVTILKLSDTEYRISGYVIEIEHSQKHVVVDGETYYKNTHEVVKYDLDAAFANNKNQFWETGTDFLEMFNHHEITFYTHKDWHKYAVSHMLSENNYVSALQVLSEYNALPFKIYAGKNEYRRTVSDFFSGCEIPVNLYGYGFGSSVNAYIKYQDYLKSKIPSNRLQYDYRLEDFFPDKIWELNEERKSELLIKYINNLKQN